MEKENDWDKFTNTNDTLSNKDIYDTNENLSICST